MHHMVQYLHQMLLLWNFLLSHASRRQIVALIIRVKKHFTSSIKTHISTVTVTFTSFFIALKLFKYTLIHYIVGCIPGLYHIVAHLKAGVYHIVAYHDRNFIKKWTSGICGVFKLYWIYVWQFLCKIKLEVWNLPPQHTI